MKNAPLFTFALSVGLALAGPSSAPAGDPPSTPPKLGGKWKLNSGLSDDPGRKMMEGMRAGGGRERGGPGGGGGMGGAGGGGGRGRGGRGGRGGGGMGGGGGQGGQGMGGRGDRGGMGGRGPGMFMMNEPPLDGADVERERPERQGPPPGQGQGGQGNAGGPPGGSGGPRGPRIAASPEFAIEQDGDNLAFRTERNLRLLHSDGTKRKKEGDSGKSEVTARIVKGTLVIETKPETGGKRKETYAIDAEGRLAIDFEMEGPGSTVTFKLVYDAVTTGQF